jgi:rhodanese-related sulfurtransferase
MSWLINLFPVLVPLQAESRVYDLKARLDWGQPALTIIDVRDRAQFSVSHILGAISMPLNELVDRALASIGLTRDIYIYGETDEETAEAAAQLRKMGYQNVSQLRGGVAAWKAVGFPIESIVQRV